MSHRKNEILLFLTDQWCDWEAGYAVAVARSFCGYAVKTIAVDREEKTSMGGVRAGVDCTIEEYADFSHAAILILPGGLSWEANDYDEIADFVKRCRNQAVPVAAICGAATFLCRHGFLNDVKHTGDSPELFQRQNGYGGEALYVPAQVVADGGFITANETAAVEFAYEIFKALQADSEDELGQWFDNFRHGAVR